MPQSRNGSKRTASERKPTEYLVLQRHEDPERGVFYTERGRYKDVHDSKACQQAEVAHRTSDDPLRHGDVCYGIPTERHWNPTEIVIETTTSYGVRRASDPAVVFAASEEEG